MRSTSDEPRSTKFISITQKTLRGGWLVRISRATLRRSCHEYCQDGAITWMLPWYRRGMMGTCRVRFCGTCASSNSADGIAAGTMAFLSSSSLRQDRNLCVQPRAFYRLRVGASIRIYVIMLVINSFVDVTFPWQWTVRRAGHSFDWIIDPRSYSLRINGMRVPLSRFSTTKCLQSSARRNPKTQGPLILAP